MNRIPAADGDAMRGPRLELGAVPDVLAALAQGPQFEALWELIRANLNEGSIPRTTRELVALAATATAGVAPLADLLRSALAERGVVTEVLADLSARGETARLPSRTQVVIHVGRRAALQPALLTDADFSRARREGLGDAELAELLTWSGVLALLIATSRALDCV